MALDAALLLSTTVFSEAIAAKGVGEAKRLDGEVCCFAGRESRGLVVELEGFVSMSAEGSLVGGSSSLITVSIACVVRRRDAARSAAKCNLSGS